LIGFAIEKRRRPGIRRERAKALDAAALQNVKKRPRQFPVWGALLCLFRFGHSYSVEGGNFK